MYTLYKAWDEITYPLRSFNGCTIEFGEWANNYLTFSWAYDYLFMLGLKLIYVTKRESLAVVISILNLKYVKAL